MSLDYQSTYLPHATSISSELSLLQASLTATLSPFSFTNLSRMPEFSATFSCELSNYSSAFSESFSSRRYNIIVVRALLLVLLEAMLMFSILALSKKFLKL